MPPSSDLKIHVPDPPLHSHTVRGASALTNVPDDVQKEWKAAYEKAFRAAVESGEQFPHSVATIAANQLLAVQQPQSHKDACSIPDWQVLRREEVEYSALPEHGRLALRDAGVTTTSGKFLFLCTTDGKQHFFPVPEK